MQGSLRRSRRIIVVSIGVLLLAGVAALSYRHAQAERWSAPILDTSRLVYAYRPGDEMSGGEGTVTDSLRSSYGRSVMNLHREHWSDFYTGKIPFIREWDTVSVAGRPVIGPLFSAVGCERCHEHDGRGRPPVSPHDISESMIVRFSVPGPNGERYPEPTYGEQLDMYGADGAAGEGIVRVTYGEVGGEFADGSGFTLMEPAYEFKHLADGPLSPDLEFSPRVAPFNFGLGLLEAIPERDILANADPIDLNHDGISGRANSVVDVKSGRPMLGRFGWKANQPTIEQQIARAFSADLGVTSAIYPERNAHTASVLTAVRSSHQAVELSEEDLRLIVFYVRCLAVPRQRDWLSPQIQHGRAVFAGIGCAGCHTAEFTTGDVSGLPELSHQRIHPYTDLLLHDMGDGLADHRPDGLATGSEWRTPPLWGIGLVKVVSGHTRFLHDGRARNLEEAILWHGGEGARSQELYRRLAKADRDALVAFLNSL
ncbi:MAG TPA: di-heme oxidoredictase family protein [Candidatus Kapabacteria bacterium]|nr:di-heme oxidoredictase family protein [Candidatus Kapabacteria bacterium]